ncbi:hypothetical protein SAMN02745938_106119 [Flavobacterium psychrophilum DSM 3660]|uniref:hypothetical protein n=1 Tax=Flavobacterium psychrophilum TaxID=96345 RepID=UPI0004F5C22C|nr:hypothetical protein [Flavobacterium psychrophilum]AIN73151.1 hypothetical protein FPG3_01175 [Flavobacterium psychrophilum FPG3]EKT4552359.1 hypothetical protein [Flavobacterium psychrophilum]MBF2045209.1 hypothetical protein [Flavobacterium psychrophilum]OXB14932.1 hypothetical protein B0A57_00680 [Flavobacterium psychrophilum DSM 3660 = ATCC 49418]SCY04338.1 hypothetical protein SAMN02745938_106119 [Flavobacterium psychrophilum DSM 3660] [Flavobacterium psychrophilum DSM 3660 = ATCC 4941
MKNLIFLIPFIGAFLVSFKPTNSSKSPSSFDYYFANSKNTWNDKEKFGKWIEKQDTVIFTLGYFRGDCCGSIPQPKNMFAEIFNDTIYYDYRNEKDPNCDSRIGICGAVIDFVINKNKYPNYKNLKWKYRKKK